MPIKIKMESSNPLDQSNINGLNNKRNLGVITNQNINSLNNNPYSQNNMSQQAPAQSAPVQQMSQPVASATMSKPVPSFCCAMPLFTLCSPLTGVSS